MPSSCLIIKWILGKIKEMVLGVALGEVMGRTLGEVMAPSTELSIVNLRPNNLRFSFVHVISRRPFHVRSSTLLYAVGPASDVNTCHG